MCNAGDTLQLNVIGRQHYQHIPYSLGGISVMQKVDGAVDVPILIVPA